MRKRSPRRERPTLAAWLAAAPVIESFEPERAMLARLRHTEEPITREANMKISHDLSEAVALAREL